jgi:hypothetical protein
MENFLWCTYYIVSVFLNHHFLLLVSSVGALPDLSERPDCLLWVRPLAGHCPVREWTGKRKMLWILP